MATQVKINPAHTIKVRMSMNCTGNYIAYCTCGWRDMESRVRPDLKRIAEKHEYQVRWGK